MATELKPEIAKVGQASLADILGKQKKRPVREVTPQTRKVRLTEDESKKAEELAQQETRRILFVAKGALAVYARPGQV